MDILIALILWFAVGFLYLINLTATRKIENVSYGAKAILLLIFLPTTVVITIIIVIENLIKRFRDGK